MAKTAKVKKPAKPSLNSRASRRASSPSLEGNLDKSLESLKPPSRSNVLAARTNAGVSKPQRKKGGKVLKRKQKVRLEQGKERAEAVIGKLERKVERSVEGWEGKKGRNADWSDLNAKISGKKTTKRDMKKAKGGDGSDGWEDEDMDTAEGITEAIGTVPLTALEPTLDGEQGLPVNAAQVGGDDVDDEIL